MELEADKRNANNFSSVIWYILGVCLVYGISGNSIPKLICEHCLAWLLAMFMMGGTLILLGVPSLLFENFGIAAIDNR